MHAIIRKISPLKIYIVLPLLKKIWLLGEEIDLQSIVHEENSDVHKNLTTNSNILTNTVKFAHYYKENLTFNNFYCTPTVEEIWLLGQFKFLLEKR